MTTVSAYRQMQNWTAYQTQFNQSLFGGSNNTVDNSAAFTNVTANFVSAKGSLAAQAALTRIQNSTAAAKAKSSGPSAVDNAPAAAKAAGYAILNSLGLVSAPPSKSSSRSSQSGPYQAPVNSATGYSYVQTNSGQMATLGTLNMFA